MKMDVIRYEVDNHNSLISSLLSNCTICHKAAHAYIDLYGDGSRATVTNKTKERGKGKTQFRHIAGRRGSPVFSIRPL